MEGKRKVRGEPYEEVLREKLWIETEEKWVVLIWSQWMVYWTLIMNQYVYPDYLPDLIEPLDMLLTYHGPIMWRRREKLLLKDTRSIVWYKYVDEKYLQDNLWLGYWYVEVRPWILTIIRGSGMRLLQKDQTKPPGGLNFMLILGHKKLSVA